MSRSTSLAFREAIYSPETGETILFLLTIDHDDLATPFRFVNDTNDIVSNGDTYIAYPFQITLPNSGEDIVPMMSLVIDNIHRDIVETIRTITSPPTITVDIVLASSPDTIEATWPEFTLRDVTYDRITISGTLGVELLQQEPFPADSYTPVHFPGLF